MKNSSLYLYDKNQRDLYKSYLGSFSKNKCFFSRHVQVYLENRENESMSFFENHLMSCQSCQEDVRQAESILKSIEHKIPFVKATNYVEEHLKTQLTEVKETLKNKQQYQKKQIRSQRLSFIGQILSDLTIGTFFNKAILKSILLAIATYYFLKWVI